MQVGEYPVSERRISVVDSPTVGNSTHVNCTLGDTVEEKTRRILGWTNGDNSKSSYWEPYYRTTTTTTADRGRRGKRWNQPVGETVPNKILKCTARGSDPTQLTPPPSPSLSPQQMLPPPYGSHVTGYSAASAGRLQCAVQGDHTCIPDTSAAYSPVSPHNGPVEPQPRRVRSASDVFELLTKRMPNLCKERNRFRTLVDMVASVVELETQLNQLKEETKKVNGMLNSRTQWHMQSSDQYSTTTQGLSAGCIPPCSASSETPLDGSSPDMMSNSEFFTDVPEDLAGIDLTAFRSLVRTGAGEHYALGFSADTEYSRSWRNSTAQQFDGERSPSSVDHSTLYNLSVVDMSHYASSVTYCDSLAENAPLL
ncbi:Dynein heavy chain [Trichuris trichiura]|uniref:Dynein heavy chain n=1 Tax=Trichuris trichiura TaxID=36087 RepID=A0A077ZDT7_TRITR|nr:Dynein heavy chain [Trichuris trichiura]